MSNLKNKAVVTGGCGFIGSHLVDKLIEKNYDVYVIDDLSAESNEEFYFNDSAKYFKFDINDDSIPHKEIFENAKYVFHLAAESRIGPAILNPVRATQINAVGTTKMLQYSRLYNVEKFIYSSTSSVYGNLCKLPTDENEPIDCLNPYSATKYSGEQMVEMYTKMYGLKTVVFRYFNVFGERSPTTGQYAPVIGIFKRQKNNNESLTIVGTGEQRRDFVHVHDIANVNILAAETPTHDGRNLYNIGTGENISINDIAKLISDDITHIPAREGEAEHTLADISEAKKHLNYNPTINVRDWILKLI